MSVLIVCGSFQVAGIHKNEYFIWSLAFRWVNVNFNWQVLTNQCKVQIFYLLQHAEGTQCMRAVRWYFSTRFDRHINIIQMQQQIE